MWQLNIVTTEYCRIKWLCINQCHTALYCMIFKVFGICLDMENEEAFFDTLFTFNVVLIFFKSKVANIVILSFLVCHLILTDNSLACPVVDSAIVNDIFPFQGTKFRCRCSSEPCYISPRWVGPFLKLNHYVVLSFFAFVWLLVQWSLVGFCRWSCSRRLQA